MLKVKTIDPLPLLQAPAWLVCRFGSRCLRVAAFGQNRHGMVSVRGVKIGNNGVQISENRES